MTRSILLIIWLAAGPAFATGELESAAAQDEQSATPESAPVVETTGDGTALPEAVETQSAPAEAAPAGEVARASFTSQIVEREPVDSIEQLSADQPQILFFTELLGLGGQTVTHRWEHGGEVMAEVPFEVGADRWRVYSSKKLLPGWVGEWSVTVLDSQGRTLTTRSFEYVTPTPASPAEENPAP